MDAKRNDAAKAATGTGTTDNHKDETDDDLEERMARVRAALDSGDGDIGRAMTAASEETAKAAEGSGNPGWLIPTAVGLIVLGFIWAILFGITGGSIGIPGIGMWNYAAALVPAIAGFHLLTKWR